MSFMSSKKFAMVPMELINRDDLNPKDKLQMIGVFVALQKFTNKDYKCFPAQETIGTIFGRSRSWANVGLKKLEELSYITKSQKNKYGTQEYSLKLHHLIGINQISPKTVSIDTPPVNGLTQSKTKNKNIPTNDIFSTWEISKKTKIEATNISNESFANKTLSKFKRKILAKYKYTFSSYEEIEEEYLKWIREDYKPKQTNETKKETQNIKADVKVSFLHIDNPIEKTIRKKLLDIVGSSVYVSWFEKTSVNLTDKTFVGTNKFHTDYLNAKYTEEMSQVFRSYK